MVDIGAWLNQGNSEAISSSDRAVDAWNRILRNPSSVEFVRGQTVLDAQSVRIEFDNQVKSEIKGDGAGTSSRRDAVIFGVKNHPSVTDTDIARGDKFAVNGQRYRVVQVIAVPGEIQATCEVLT